MKFVAKCDDCGETRTLDDRGLCPKCFDVWWKNVIRGTFAPRRPTEPNLDGAGEPIPTKTAQIDAARERLKHLKEFRVENVVEGNILPLVPGKVYFSETNPDEWYVVESLAPGSLAAAEEVNRLMQNHLEKMIPEIKEQWYRRMSLAAEKADKLLKTKHLRPIKP